MKLTFLALFFGLLAVSQATIWIWSPPSGAVYFYGEWMSISWACERNVTNCDHRSFEFHLYQSSTPLDIFIMVVGVSNPNISRTTIRWRVSDYVPPGDGFYIKIFEDGVAVECNSQEFSIYASGIQFLSPSESTIWTPSVNNTIQFVVSPKFMKNNDSLLGVLTKKDQSDWVRIIGMFNLSSHDDYTIAIAPNQIPWADIESGLYYLKFTLNNRLIGSSLNFIIHQKAQVACDPYSLAAVFSNEVYTDLSLDRVYYTCGTGWITEFAYNENDDAAVIVSNAAAKSAIVAFRGTVLDLADWVNSLSLHKVDCNDFVTGGCRGGSLHKGFARSFNATKLQIRAHVLRLAQQGYLIVLTGHSKGASIASIQALDLLQTYPDVIKPSNLLLATFGTPRAGTQQFAEVLNTVLPPVNCNSVRFIGVSRFCGNDPVTGLPMMGSWTHAGQPREIKCTAWCLAARKQPAAQGIAVSCHSMDRYVVSVAVQGAGRC